MPVMLTDRLHQWKSRYLAESYLPIAAFTFAAGLIIIVWAVSWNVGPDFQQNPATQPMSEADAKPARLGAGRTSTAEWGLRNDPYVKRTLWVGYGLCLIGVVCGWRGFANQDPPSAVLPGATAAARAEIAEIGYRRAMIGIGYALLLAGVLNMVAFAGFASTKQIDEVLGKREAVEVKQQPAGKVRDRDVTAQGAVAPATTTQGATSGTATSNGDGKADAAPIAESVSKQEQTDITGPTPGLPAAILLMISLGMSILGALFFVANSLREKRDEFEQFDHSGFWSGLWYRLGEAVLFTVVFFLVLRRFYPASGALWLPVLALFLGMFVKSGERLVFGLAKRVFAAVSTLLPINASDFDGSSASAAVVVPAPVGTVAAVKGQAPGEATVSWKPPAGAAPALYVVERRAAPAAAWEEAQETRKETVTLQNEPEGAEYRVYAVNQAGRGEPSDPVIAT